MYCESLNEELTYFYEQNQVYLKVVYSSQDDFINSMLEECNDGMTRNDILWTNIKVAQHKHTINDIAYVQKLQEQMNNSNIMKEYDELNKQINKINKNILKKRNFIKQFYITLKV